MPRVLGIDFGFSQNRPSLGYSQFHTLFDGTGTYTIRVLASTLAVTLDCFTAHVIPSHVFRRAKVIALDAPVTPCLIVNRPPSGRLIERRFSRGDFANGKRGPQPSSIRVPKQGWPLYSAAMVFLTKLAGAGFNLFPIPPKSSPQQSVKLGKSVVEVIPKLTQALLTPKTRIAGRPSKKADKFYGQIDNWLFPHLFVTAAPSPATPSASAQPSFGVDNPGLSALFGPTVSIHHSVWDEANRIQQVGDLAQRHELIGAFAAGLQGALGLAGAAQLVGAAGSNEGYYLLPVKWHTDWQAVWTATVRKKDAIYSVPVAPYRP